MKMTLKLKAYIARRAFNGEHTERFGVPVYLHFAALIAVSAALLTGCSGSDVFTGEVKDNLRPTI